MRGAERRREDLQPGEDGGHPHLPPPPQIVRRLQPNMTRLLPPIPGGSPSLSLAKGEAKKPVFASSLHQTAKFTIRSGKVTETLNASKFSSVKWA